CLVRRLHDRLAGIALERALSSSGLARGRVQPDEHVRCDRGTVVPGAGFRWSALDRRRNLREALAAHLRGLIRKIQNADARHCRRTGLPRAVHTKPRVFYGAATTRCAFKACGLSRRGTLDPETAKQPALVRRGDRAGPQKPWAGA